jgi:hypothetical protein
MFSANQWQAAPESYADTVTVNCPDVDAAAGDCLSR